MSERVWIVMDFDCDNSLRIVAAYPTEILANEHIALMGGYIEKQEVRSALHPDASDPVKQEERAAELDAARKAYLIDIRSINRKERSEKGDRKPLQPTTADTMGVKLSRPPL